MDKYTSIAPSVKQPKLLDRVKHAIRTKHYSQSTEQTYIKWIKEYIFFHQKRHPLDLGEQHVNRFLTHLAVNKKVAASTQNQALCAIVFLYKHVLDKELGDFGNLFWAKKSKQPVGYGMVRKNCGKYQYRLFGITILRTGLYDTP